MLHGGALIYKKYTCLRIARFVQARGGPPRMLHGGALMYHKYAYLRLARIVRPGGPPSMLHRAALIYKKYTYFRLARVVLPRGPTTHAACRLGGQGVSWASMSLCALVRRAAHAATARSECECCVQQALFVQNKRASGVTGSICNVLSVMRTLFVLWRRRVCNAGRCLRS